jgi:hypothetical protein
MFKFDADTPNLDTGAWTEFQGSKFLIAHISNMRFQRALARLQQPHRRKLEAGTLDPQVNKDILCKAMAEGILIGWENVANSKGEVTAYSPQAAFIALSKSADFRDFVSEFATNLSNFRAEELEDMGNV